MILNLVADKVVRGKIYPSLAKFQAEPYTSAWREFGQHWPNTIPIRLQEYCEGHGIHIHLHNIYDCLPNSTFYPIALGWYNFDIDYFSLIPRPVFALLQTQQLKVLFYYHEGDNPARIQQHLDRCISLNKLPEHCYIFISSNSAADQLPRFVSFQDSELWYWHRNRAVPACSIGNGQRSREFTVLNRLHKWWRAAVMADLAQHGVLDHSFWSYCQAETNHDQIENCPIEIDAIDNLRHNITNFLAGAPYLTDDFTQDQRNDHHLLVEKLYTDSYCNIVLETMFDWDQSGGVLISEKTFKPIKHAQLFFIAGGAGSLQLLRDLGYKTFDNILDNSYDLETNNTKRWLALRNAIVKAKRQGIKLLFEQAKKDIVHNQQLFLASKHQRLSMLLEKINDKSS